MAQKDILVFADWNGFDAPVKIGILHSVPVRGKEVFSFEYDDTWIKSGKYHFLDPDLKLLSGPQYLSDEKTNFGMFLDSSPDRWGRLLMTRREAVDARKEGRKSKPLLESDFLLGVHDKLRMGALRFRMNEESPFLNNDASLTIPPWTSIRELEQASIHLEKDETMDDPQYTLWLNMLLSPGSSLGGARPKASVTDPKKALWIAKFPSKHDATDIGGWEMVVSELAGRCGITVPESVARKFSASAHTFLTKRFDRTPKGERIHFASAMTLLGYTEGTDFHDGASYLEFAEFIMKAGADVNNDLEEVWRRIVFSICVKNTDDHLRNHGFLLTDHGWKLSPAYDMNPNPRGTGLTLNVSLNDNSLDLDLAMEVRTFFRVSGDKSREIIEKVKNEVKNWRKIADKQGIPRSEQEMMSPAFPS